MARWINVNNGHPPANTPIFVDCGPYGIFQTDYEKGDLREIIVRETSEKKKVIFSDNGYPSEFWMAVPESKYSYDEYMTLFDYEG
jgi:hypothetical protein